MSRDPRGVVTAALFIALLSLLLSPLSVLRGLSALPNRQRSTLMATFRILLLLFAAAALCKTSFGQNCSHLPRPSGSPLPTPSPGECTEPGQICPLHNVFFIIGNDLTYCRTSESQCCSESYLTSEANSLKNNRLLDSLHDQLNETGGKLDRIGNRLLNCKLALRLDSYCTFA